MNSPSCAAHVAPPACSSANVPTRKRLSRWERSTATVMGLLSSTLARVLHSEALYPRLRTGVFDAMIVLYAAYMVLGIWGAAALFRSYIRLSDANKVLTHPKLA